MKIQKTNWGGGGSGPRWSGGEGGRPQVWGVRVDVNGEVSFCENSKKNIFFFGGGGVWGGPIGSLVGVGEGG